MKIAGASSLDKPAEGSDAILPLVEAPPKKLPKDRYAVFKLQTDPGVAGSSTYDVSIAFCDQTNTVREAIKARSEILRVAAGNNVADAAGLDNLAKAVYRGACLTAYNFSRESERLRLEATAHTAAVVAENRRRAAAAPVQAAMTEAQETVFRAALAAQAITVDCVHNGLFGAINSVCPHNTLERIKRYLRRQCRKPADMKVREYAVRLSYINEMEIPMLPPRYNNTQALSDNELVEILTYGLPKSWTKRAIADRFDPYNKTLGQCVTYFEAIEASEDFSPERAVQSKASAASKKSKKDNNKKKSYDSSKKCPIHGPGHSAEECRTLKNLVDKEKNSGSYSKNKTWTRKADDAKSKTKKDLAAVIKKAVRKELHSSEKKRKEASSDEESANQASDDESVNMADVDFTDLQLDSGDEISV